jgi:spore maturation protein B
MRCQLDLINTISIYAIPLVFLIILGTGLYKNIKVYDIFTEGAKEGLKIIIRIIPSLIGLMTALAIFRASGALDIIIYIFKPLLSFIGIPYEIVPLIFLRPFSGSASLIMITDIMKNYGPDSFIGRVASTMMGSTETLFYTVCIYLGAVGIKNTRYIIKAAIIAECVSIIMSVFMCSIIFPN